jgi:hypothetical protein
MSTYSQADMQRYLDTTAMTAPEAHQDLPGAVAAEFARLVEVERAAENLTGSLRYDPVVGIHVTPSTRSAWREMGKLLLRKRLQEQAS